MNQKTYTELREQTDIESLNEVRVMRAGAVLYMFLVHMIIHLIQ